VRRAATVRIVGPMQWIVYPALVAMGLTIVLATPVSLFGLKLPEPILPLVLAFAWPLIRPSMLAPFVLFLLGLFLDLLLAGQQPLGVWSLSLMVVYGVVLAARNLLAGQETQNLFVWYACCTLAAFLLTYLIVSMKSANAPSILSLLGQLIPTLLLFPVANWMIERFDDGDMRLR
jgi:rod shape-determining protein MreD